MGALVALLHLVTSVSGAFIAGAFGDDGVYLVLGRALADGHGYRSMHLVGTPVHVKYPPGFPFILSLLWRVGESVDAVQRLVGWLHPVVVGAGAGMCWWIGRARLQAPRALLVLLVLLPFAFEASVEYYGIALSEPWFILCWATVTVLWCVITSTTPGARRSWQFALLGLSVAAAILVRTQGVALVPALVAAIFLARTTRVERLIAAVAAFAPLAAWFAYHHALVARGPVSSLAEETSYVDWMVRGGAGAMHAFVENVQFNVLWYLRTFGAYVSAMDALGVACAAVLFGGMIVAACVALRREPLLALSSLGGVSIVALWPFAQDRLLLPVLPFLGLAAAAAVVPTLRRAPAVVGRAVAYVSLAACALVLMRQPEVRREGIRAAAEGRGPAFYTPVYALLTNSRFASQASRWVRENTPAADHVMIDYPSAANLYSGHLTVPATQAESRLLESVFVVPGRYVAASILRDSVRWVIPGIVGGDREGPGILRDLDTIMDRCPGVLTSGVKSERDYRYIFRVSGDLACLSGIAAGGDR